MNDKADMRRAMHSEYLCVSDKAALELARAYDPGASSVSWKNQIRAALFYSMHGLEETLDEIARLNSEARDWEALLYEADAEGVE